MLMDMVETSKGKKAGGVCVGGVGGGWVRGGEGGTGEEGGGGSCGHLRRDSILLFTLLSNTRSAWHTLNANLSSRERGLRLAGN